MTLKFKTLLCLVLAGTAIAQAPKPQPLRFQKSIPLPGVEGRLDHMTVDLKGQRLFVAATGNGSVEVIDLKAGKLVRSVKGFKGPQGIVYSPESNQLVVTGRDDGAIQFLDGTSLAVLVSVNKFTNGNIVRYDPATKTVVAGYGDGALGFFDLSGKQLAEVRLDSHPEAFVIERQGPRILVNTPTSKGVIVVDRLKKSIVRTWPLTTGGSNYALAFDEANRRIFLACRRPPRLITLDSSSGIQLDDRETVGDVNDIYYDATRKRIYVSGGDGQVDIIRQVDANTYEPLAKVNTGAGARTSLFVPESNTLFVAIPHRGNQQAEVRVFDVVN